MNRVYLMTSSGAHRLHASPVELFDQDDPYCNLVIAMVRQSVKDLKSKTRKIRDDAIWFFLSDWFRDLTGLDGEDILDRLTYWR